LRHSRSTSVMAATASARRSRRQPEIISPEGLMEKGSRTGPAPSRYEFRVRDFPLGLGLDPFLEYDRRSSPSKISWTSSASCSLALVRKRRPFGVMR
jgi:hypothetical protein